MPMVFCTPGLDPGLPLSSLFSGLSAEVLSTNQKIQPRGDDLPAQSPG